MNNYYNYQNYLNQAKQTMDPVQSQENESARNINSNMMNLPAQPMAPAANPNAKLYEPYEGFIRGNMFPSLYDPYKLKTPYEIKPMNEQADMLTYIDSLGFAMIDLNLYLDLHPNDRQMIDLYNQYRIQKEDILRQYEDKYGPIVTTSNALNQYPWAWINRPWPWENK